MLWDVMFHQNIQDALKANHDILDLVDSGYTITVINVSIDGLPLVMKGMSQVGTMKEFLTVILDKPIY